MSHCSACCNCIICTSLYQFVKHRHDDVWPGLFSSFFSPCCAEPLPSLRCVCRFLFLLPSAKVFFFLRYRYFWSALLTERTLETKHSCERTFTREGSCLYTIAALLAACRRDPFFIRAAFSFRFKLLRHCSSLRGSLTQFYFFLYLWVRTLELFTFFFVVVVGFFLIAFYTPPLSSYLPLIL